VERTRIDGLIGDELGEALVDPATPPAADIPLVLVPRRQAQPAVGIQTFDNHLMI